MKNFLLAFSIASIFAACSTESKKELETKTDMVPINTAGYTISNTSTDVGSSDQEEEYIAPVRKRTSARKSNSTKTRDYVAETKQQSAPVANNTSNTSATVPETKTTETAPSTGMPSANGSGETASAGNSTEGTEKTTKKKGWSDAAKGAVIGGAAGAIGGAIINGKNRGVGAVVGAVIGAAGGYAIGRKRDKDKQASDYSMVVN